MKVELILTGGTAATLAAKSVTTTIPIVFNTAADPVGAGLVASLGRPGGNVTGYAILAPQMNAKRLALLRECLPTMRRVGILLGSDTALFPTWREGLEQACRSLRIEPVFAEASAGDVANAVAEVARRGAQGLLIPAGQFEDYKSELMAAVLRYALPAATPDVLIRELGALICYERLGSEQTERVAALVDRILRGARPSDLPVAQPTKFVLTINLRTARALSITIPKSVLSRADEVIR